VRFGCPQLRGLPLPQRAHAPNIALSIAAVSVNSRSLRLICALVGRGTVSAITAMRPSRPLAGHGRMALRGSAQHENNNPGGNREEDHCWHDNSETSRSGRLHRQGVGSSTGGSCAYLYHPEPHVPKHRPVLSAGKGQPNRHGPFAATDHPWDTVADKIGTASGQSCIVSLP
jgi:hypothetical protein